MATKALMTIQQFDARPEWVLYPEARLAYLCRPGERIEVRDDTQTLDNAELLPGFGVALSEIFGA